MNTTATKIGFNATQTSAAQPARETNLDTLVAFFESGIKPSGSHGKLGIELEQIIVKEDGSPVSYSEDHGVAWLLGELSATYPEKTTDDEGDLLGLARSGEAVTIEPAAQLELSAGPFDDLSCAVDVFSDFQTRVIDILKPVHKRIMAIGYHPTSSARDLELIPKQRYEFMNKYLSEADCYGPCMMRGSASTQISIDYTSAEDCLRKMKIAYALVPLLSLICDNSPIFEGARRKHKLIRADIWRHVDNDRCGLVPGIFDESFTLRDYAAFVLDCPAIVTPSKNGGWEYSTKTFGEIYAQEALQQSDIEHAVSMQFPDVRLKTYIEIRPADSMPVPYVIAYAALIKGLFYSEKSLSKLDDLFAGVTESAYEAAKDALMERGYEATVYGDAAATLCDAIVEIASDALDDNDRSHMQPLIDLVSRRITLADMAEGSR